MKLAIIWGLLQIAIVELEIFAPSNVRGWFFAVEAIIVFVTGAVISYQISDIEDRLRVALLTQLVTWLPVLLLNSPVLVGEPLFESSSSVYYVVLFFYGVVFLVSGIAGSILGPVLIDWYAQSGEEYVNPLRLSDDELLEEYDALQSKMSDPRGYSAGDSEILSTIETELHRRGLGKQKP